MISTLLMISVVVILGVTLAAARASRRRQAQLQRDNQAMLIELDRHRQTLHSILRELANP